MEVTPWNPSCTSESEKSHKFNFSLSFNKHENHHWYVDIPYEGPYWDLRMVSGADSFLEALAKGKRRVTVQFCDHDFEGCQHRWKATKESEPFGRTYEVASPDYEGTAWLCSVMKYVLGFYPDQIYIKLIEASPPQQTLNQLQTQKSSHTSTMKKIVVISPNHGDGKTSMVEAIVGHPLQWYPSEMKSDQLDGQIMCADIRYAGLQFRVFEIPPFKKEHPEVSEKKFDTAIIDLVINADLVIEVQDSSGYITFSPVSDLFKVNVGGKEIKDIISERKMLVYTKIDKDSQLITWWYGLTEQEREEYNKKNQETGNPRYSTYLLAALNEESMCAAMYPFEGDYNMMYDISAKDTSSMEELLEGLRNFFIGSR